MTSPISSIPSVREYLFQQITTAVAAGGFKQPSVEVFRSVVDYNTPNDIIVVGGAKRQTKPGAMVGGGGAHWRFEEYHVEVDIQCSAWGVDDSTSVVEDRAYQLLALVESAVRADPGLGGRVLVAYPSESEDTTQWDDSHKGAVTHIQSLIYVHNEQ